MSIISKRLITYCLNNSTVSLGTSFTSILLSDEDTYNKIGYNVA